MSPTEIIQAFEARLALYSIDDRARRTVTESWPADRARPGTDDRRDPRSSSALPNIGKTVAANRDLVKQLELAHFRALLGGKLEGDYAESCRRTVEQEAALGLDGRIRSTAGSYVLKAALDALASHYRFSAAPSRAARSFPRSSASTSRTR